MALPLIRPPKKTVNAGLNDHIVALLQSRIREYELNPQGPKKIIIALKRAITSIRAHPKRLNNGTEAQKCPNVGDKIGDMIDTFLPYFPPDDQQRFGPPAAIQDRFRASIAEAMEDEDSEDDENLYLPLSTQSSPIRGQQRHDPISLPSGASSPSGHTPTRPNAPSTALSSPSSVPSPTRSLPDATPLTPPLVRSGSTSLPSSPPRYMQEAQRIPFSPLDNIPGRRAEPIYAYDDAARIQRRQAKSYRPKDGTGNWAILITLLIHAGPNGSLEETDLRNLAERYSNESMWGNQRQIYSAFSNVDRLIKAGYIDTFTNPTRYHLTLSGVEIAKKFYADSTLASPTHPTHLSPKLHKNVPPNIYAATGPDLHPTYAPRAILPINATSAPSSPTRPAYASTENTSIPLPSPVAHDRYQKEETLKSTLPNNDFRFETPTKKKRGRPKKNAASEATLNSSQTSQLSNSSRSSYPPSSQPSTQPNSIEFDHYHDFQIRDDSMNSPEHKRPKLTQSVNNMPPRPSSSSNGSAPQIASPMRHVSSPSISSTSYSNDVARAAQLLRSPDPHTTSLAASSPSLASHSSSRSIPTTPTRSASTMPSNSPNTVSSPLSRAAPSALQTLPHTALRATATALLPNQGLPASSPSSALPTVANSPLSPNRVLSSPPTSLPPPLTLEANKNNKFQPHWRREVYIPPESNTLTTFVRDPGFDRVDPGYRSPVVVPPSVASLDYVPLSEEYLKAPLRAHRIERVVLEIDVNELGIDRTRNVDYYQRELEDLGVTVRSMKLSLGDFLWVGIDSDGNTIVLNTIIERKAVDDLGQSIIDGRYSNQIWRLRHSGLARCIYLIEGHIDPAISDYPVSMASLLQAQMKVGFAEPFLPLHSRDRRDSVRYIDALSKVIEAQFVGQTVYTTSDACIEALKVRHHGATNFEKFEHCVVDDSALCWTFDQFQTYFTKRKQLTGPDLFGLQMMSFYGSTAETAAAIVSVWKSLPNLLAIIEMTTDPKERFSLISAIEINGVPIPQELAMFIVDTFVGLG